MNAKKSIATGAGDNGTTWLFSGEEVSKNSPVVDACGDIDELVSFLGIARSKIKEKDIKSAIYDIQKTLFIVASEISATPKKALSLKKRISKSDVDFIEERIRLIENEIELKAEFSIAGESFSSSCIDYARAIARRCERKIIALSELGMIKNRALCIWMNRVSDYLYLLARLEEKSSND